MTQYSESEFHTVLSLIFLMENYGILLIIFSNVWYKVCFVFDLIFFLFAMTLVFHIFEII